MATKQGKWGYYNGGRQLIFPFEYDQVQYTLESFIVKKATKMGLLSLQGEVLISVEQDSVLRLVGNLTGGINYCYAVLNDGKWKLFNNKGESISELEFDSVGVIDRNLLITTIESRTYMGHYYQGELKLFTNHPFQFVSRMTYWNSTSIYKKDGKFGLFRIIKHMADAPGTYTTEPIYDSIVMSPMSDMFICEREGKWGIVNSRGEEIVRTEYEYFSQRDWFENVIHYLVFYKEDTWHCIDKSGKVHNCSDVNIVPGSANESVRKL